jgi:phage terminase large subunit GpA-like protein
MTFALSAEFIPAILLRLQRGFAAWGIPEPLSLAEWAEQHFHLSAESSYVEQDWTAWPYQRAILATISNDDIREVIWIKSARTGYTKIILAAQGYFAHHKRRNQALWQPTDDDATAYVKTELDPMLRDVSVMRDVFPTYLARHKDNTLDQKKFIGSMLHIKGGKAAKNYRRISVDVAYLDEVDAFDGDVEKEGDPITLAAKRTEGATFPKLVLGSTPKLKGFSLIETRALAADERMTYHIPCPHCGDLHALTWGGTDIPHGMKWRHHDDGAHNVDSVQHLCPHCAALINQGDYLAVWERGVWVNETATLWLHANGEFTDPTGQPMPPPRTIAFHTWTAYSPAANWPDIVREYIAAAAKMDEGDDAKMKAFKNTYLGETWEGEIERGDADELKNRAEPYPLRYVPRDCLLLLCGVDTQGNRLEAQIWGYGRAGQMWSIDHRQFFGNPAQEEVWDELEEFLFGEVYRHASGADLQIYATAVDSGGHHTDAVYAFAAKHKSRRVRAVKGSSGAESGIQNGNRKVDYDWRGRRAKAGTILWHVGTHLAKDRLASRLEITQIGPGYVHLSREHTDEWFRQLASEDRVTVRGKYGTSSRWTPNRKRNEVLDMTAYVIWLEEHLDLWRPKRKAWWDELEARIQPAISDLFSPAPMALPATPASTPAAAVVATSKKPASAWAGSKVDLSQWGRA